jgi:large subunit ribosomal protein L21e
MEIKKNLREHGKIRLSNYFQEFKEGERVAVVQELAMNPAFPRKLQGLSGKILKKRGEAYEVAIKDLNKEKIYIIHPVHLRRLK